MEQANKQSKAKGWKTALYVLFLPLVVLWGISWVLNRMRFLEATLIMGIGFFLGWRFGIGKLDPNQIYYLGIPCWVELLIAGLLFIILGLKMMLTAKERVKIGG